MSVTLEEIARQAGVHPATVSRVLHGGVSYKRPTFAKRAEAIRSIAARLGYQANAAARAVATQRFGAIGLLQHLDGARSFLPQEMLAGIEFAAGARGQAVVLARCGDPAVAPDDGPPVGLRNRTVDGLLVNINLGADARLARMLQRLHVPSVWLNDARSHDTVAPDDEGAGQALAAHLIARGARHVVYVGVGVNPDFVHYSKVDRPQGCQTACAASGTPYHELLGDAGITALAATLRDLRRAGSGPIAVITYSEYELHTILATLFIDLGLRPGVDLLVGTFLEPFAQRTLLSAAMVAPRRDLGEAAVAMLLAKIEAPKRRFPRVVLPWQLWSDQRLK